MRVAEPTANWHCVLRVEDVARRGVVDDDGLAQVPPNLTEVLDVVALVIVAAVAEQAVMDDVMDV